MLPEFLGLSWHLEDYTHFSCNDETMVVVSPLLSLRFSEGSATIAGLWGRRGYGLTQLENRGFTGYCKENEPSINSEKWLFLMWVKSWQF